MMIGWILPLVLLVLLLSLRGDERSSRGWISALILGLVALYGVGFLGMGGMHSWGWGWGRGWGWDGWTLPSLLGSLALLGAAGAGIWVLLRRSPPAESEAEQILRLRLARGEITAEEYDLLRKKVQAD